MKLRRRELLVAGAALAAVRPAFSAGLDVSDRTLSDLSQSIGNGTLSSVALVEAYLARIAQLDAKGPTLKAVLELNGEALQTAKALDAERASRGIRGPLHGVPMLVKDNLDTADTMKTTAGSLAMLDAPAPARDSFVVQKLREAGVVLLGKTNLSEWANMRGKASVSGWSGRGGQTRNPFVLARNPSGSSSGSAVAVAAGLCAAAIGTETDGSITSPASNCGVVGFKPTVGLVSRSGIIPIAHSQDTAGPMTRSVRDAALVLDAIAGVDARDVATAVKHAALPSFAAAIDGASLKGGRLGLAKNLVSMNRRVGELTKQMVAALTEAGAVVVEVEMLDAPYGKAELEVLLFELKADLNAYLKARGGPMVDLAAVIAFNDSHPSQELGPFGQEWFVEAQAKGALSSAAYRQALATCGKARGDLETLHKKNRLDAIIAPSGSPAWLTDAVNGDSFGFAASTVPAVAGAPHLTVPMGFIDELPVGLSFIGVPWGDAKVLALGHAFEGLTHARRAPKYL